MITKPPWNIHFVEKEFMMPKLGFEIRASDGQSYDLLIELSRMLIPIDLSSFVLTIIMLDTA